ncbi:MAG: hypothetical protein VX660_00270, partial [Candidatus Thermoplasmatota archaeon]|nr:hypothetical protein [Candidatus Thermoplasmatota archaeon]
VLSTLVFFIWGVANGGIAWPEFWDIGLSAVPLGLPRAGAHTLPTLIIMYNIIAWYGSAKGGSPNKDTVTILLSPIVTFTLHWNYGMGVLRGRWRRLFGKSGLQIDDRSR